MDEFVAVTVYPVSPRSVLCPVTMPPREPFRPPPPDPATAPYGGQFWYGAEALWTMLPADGRWDQFAHGEKLWWWRLGYDGREEPQPALRVTTRRLDGPAPLMGDDWTHLAR